MAVFDNIEENKVMIEGSFKKLKAYYYYNKNLIILREKIAQFENDPDQMHATISTLAKNLKHAGSIKSMQYFNNLISSIDFYCLPKKFVIDNPTSSNMVTNTSQKDKKLKSINFFIEMPFELYLLDTLWTLIIGKVVFDKHTLSEDIYGNTLIDNIFTEDYEEGTPLTHTINFKNNRMFNIYFRKYCQWRNRAFDCMEEIYDDKKHSYLISLDIRSFFYSVRFSFHDLNRLLGYHPLLKELSSLTSIIQKMYKQYYEVISPFRLDIPESKNEQYPLPIGLTSSMVIANLYLCQFDKLIKKNAPVAYYGRYVDDVLLVIKSDISTETKAGFNPVEHFLVSSNILKCVDADYSLVGYNDLLIQKDKIKVIHIDPRESRALLDVYENTVKIIPSQLAVIPDYDVSIDDFEESAYVIENFSREKKVRDIGVIGVDPFKVSRFFSTLVHKQKNIGSLNNSYLEKIEAQIRKIEHFFTGSQSIEFYTTWLYYMYFLVLLRDHGSNIQKFIKIIHQNISATDGKYLDRSIFRKRTALGIKIRSALNDNLRIAVASALAIDYPLCETPRFENYKDLCVLLYNANLFDHALVRIPLANYLNYSSHPSYIDIDLHSIGVFDSFTESPKFKWPPRFIHYEELLLLKYFLTMGAERNELNKSHFSSSMVSEFSDINGIYNHRLFSVRRKTGEFADYLLRKYTLPFSKNLCTDDLKIGIGNVRIDLENCFKNVQTPSCGMTIELKSTFRKIIADAYLNNVNIIVFPELFLPVYWLSELLDFARKSQIAIVTGLQYIAIPNNTVTNNLAVILPFETGVFKYKNTFVYIREKNDYSPIEIEKLSKIGYRVRNPEMANYQVFNWNNICVSPFLCFEFTDIMARALVKGKCDILTVSVVNPDTSYFSDIINCATRDLHTIIVQANTSNYGDSRITCPYDRDSRDILKIKGGDNDFLLFGKVDLRKIVDYQRNYYSEQSKLIERNLAGQKSKKGRKRLPDCKNCKHQREKPEIKKLSARYHSYRRTIIK